MNKIKFTFVNPSKEEKSSIINEPALRNIKIRAMNRGLRIASPDMKYKERVEIMSQQFCVSDRTVQDALGEF